MNKIINTSTKYIFPIMLVAIFASLSSCNSSPNSSNVDSQAANTTTLPTPNSETPTAVTPSPIPTASISPTPSQTPTTANLNTQSSNKPPLPEETPTQNKTSSQSAAATKRVDVTLYTSDAQCQDLIPQKIEVSAAEPVTGTVGKILEQRDSADFRLSGYDVNIRNGVATVDLRVSSKSQRQIASLSSCEQFALFGSLRKTLTSNSQWGIKEVRFTEKGEEIVL
ncbi:GerMN domain-containing protein [Chlorogloeopsis sp. ULAP01]|uniref:GerMN domain-containing protein n=1 Tax=Chlorogloeopsis sp. ULAP01 TaxID=3056483 RepID=UPI0025AAE437|nr:GerMN domain-containing protein [Chlorogloeopsis sp. ULAP01]MDM9379302.1 GerMN domain-containing protein [Chlorogloeopsis sp. ULAP01]